MAVMNTIDLTGVSTESWADAARQAIKEASRTIRQITKLDIISTSVVVQDGVIAEYHTEVRLFFKVEDR